MIWAAFRLSRTPLIVSLCFIAVLIVSALVAGVYAPQYPQSPWTFPAICSRWNDVGPCRPETALTMSTLFALLLPPLLGVFVGVTAFSREIDSRTHVLSLTQSGSRNQWYFARVCVVFLPISLAMVGLGLALHWASGRARRSTRAYGEQSVTFSLFDFPHFETAGVTLGAYTLFMLLVGGTMALVFKSGVAAMLATAGLFVFVPVVFTWIVRDDYGSPQVRSEGINGLARASEYGPNPFWTSDGTWVIGAGYVDAQGESVDTTPQACHSPYPGDYGTQLPGDTNEQRWARMRSMDSVRAERFDSCLRGQGVDRFDVYSYTEDSYWRFQGIEAGSMLLFATAVSAVGVWRAHRID